jgi:hypothetical protein
MHPTSKGFRALYPHTGKHPFWVNLAAGLLKFCCSKVLIIDGPFCSGDFNSFKSFFFYCGFDSSTVDLKSDYYSSRCKDISDLQVFKRTFMTFVGGGDGDPATGILFYNNGVVCRCGLETLVSKTNFKIQ